MAFAAGGLLASEVSLAGGFGFMAPGRYLCTFCRQTVGFTDEICACTTVPGQDISHWNEQLSIAQKAFPSTTKPLPIGAGFLGWILDAQSPVHGDNTQTHKPTNEFLQAALDAHVRAVWLSFGNDLKRWIDVVREHDRATGNVDKKNKTLIFVQVGSVEQARVAYEQWRVDVLAVQGMYSHSFL